MDSGALADLIKNSGISYRENNVSWIFECPRCNKKDKLYIRKSDGRFVCWRCRTDQGFQGRPEFALKDLLGRPLSEIKEILYGLNSVDNSDPVLHVSLRDFFDDNDDDGLFSNTPYIKPTFFPEDFYALDHPFSEKGLKYLEGRGIPLFLAQKFELRYHPRENRVVFPIIVEGRLVGWQARHIKPEFEFEGKIYKVPKILTGPNSFKDRDKCFMFQDSLVGFEHAILTEGPVDAIKCWMCGPAIASMGKSISQGQIDVINNSGIKNVYLALDPDAASEKTRLCQRLTGKNLFEMIPPKPYKDFGEMDPKDVLLVFKNARSINASLIFSHYSDPYTTYNSHNESCR